MAKDLSIKKTMTVNLSEKEMKVIEYLCDKQGLSKNALMKQCLRLYQVVYTRVESGEKLYFEGEDKEKAEVVLL